MAWNREQTDRKCPKIKQEWGRNRWPWCHSCRIGDIPLGSPHSSPFWRSWAREVGVCPKCRQSKQTALGAEAGFTFCLSKVCLPDGIRTQPQPLFLGAFPRIPRLRAGFGGNKLQLLLTLNISSTLCVWKVESEGAKHKSCEFSNDICHHVVNCHNVNLTEFSLILEINLWTFVWGFL